MSDEAKVCEIGGVDDGALRASGDRREHCAMSAVWRRYAGLQFQQSRGSVCGRPTPRFWPRTARRVRGAAQSSSCIQRGRNDG